MILSDLGWRIRRIWSTEWWMDASSAAEKIHARLTADLQADRASRPETPEEPVSEDANEQRAIAPEKAEDEDPQPTPAVALPTLAKDSAPAGGCRRRTCS